MINSLLASNKKSCFNKFHLLSNLSSNFFILHKTIHSFNDIVERLKVIDFICTQTLHSFQMFAIQAKNDIFFYYKFSILIVKVSFEYRKSHKLFNRPTDRPTTCQFQINNTFQFSISLNNIVFFGMPKSNEYFTRDICASYSTPRNPNRRITRFIMYFYQKERKFTFFYIHGKSHQNRLQFKNRFKTIECDE